jgi:hypothetical protein
VKDDAADAADAAVVVAERTEPMIPAQSSPSQNSAPEDGEGAPNVWSDEAAESAFIAEARGRGESAVASKATLEVVEDEKKPLPAMADLMKRLPPGVKETLDELFRAKFTVVRRVPKKALKGAVD